MNKWILLLVVVLNLFSMGLQAYLGSAWAAGLWGLASGIWLIQCLDRWFKDNDR